jgi:DNA-binding SARP family transcriptional activator
MAATTVGYETGQIEFRILGPLEILRSGRPVPLGGPRQRAVLALLLLEANRVVSMDRLAEDIWAGHPPRRWVTTLQTYVFHLRRALEPDRLPGQPGGVSWRPEAADTSCTWTASIWTRPGSRTSTLQGGPR